VCLSVVAAAAAAVTWGVVVTMVIETSPTIRFPGGWRSRERRVLGVVGVVGVVAGMDKLPSEGPGDRLTLSG